MLEIAELRKQLRALDDSDDALKRQALQALRGYNEPDWATVPADVCDALVKSLQTHLHKPSKQPSTQKEAATILGNLGVRSRAAVPQLIELLRAGGPDAILEAVATALGKIGKEAKAAVDPLLRLLAEARPSLAARAIRALGSLRAVPAAHCRSQPD
jgi:HEAT repeat protein